MDAKRSIKWMSNGTEVEIKIERTMSVTEKISYSDGWNINLGKEAVDLIEIEVYANGKKVTSSLHEPMINNPRFCKNAPAGSYASINKIYMKKDRYDQIMVAIAEMEVELTSPEYAAIKAEEAARELAADKALEIAAAEHARQIKNGLCPKCGTYCYGDCEAN